VKIVVLGRGAVGTHAAQMAAGPGAEVTILDRSPRCLRGLEELFEGRVRTRFSTLVSIEEEMGHADAVSGCGSPTACALQRFYRVRCCH
jgi:alanine dehydrogenase